ncbi:hypothetical protein V8C35DRAFT_315370 [Trichoderma chlorosporum]
MASIFFDNTERLRRVNELVTLIRALQTEISTKLGSMDEDVKNNRKKIAEVLKEHGIIGQDQILENLAQHLSDEEIENIKNAANQIAKAGETIENIFWLGLSAVAVLGLVGNAANIANWMIRQTNITAVTYSAISNSVAITGGTRIGFAAVQLPAKAAKILKGIRIAGHVLAVADLILLGVDIINQVQQKSELQDAISELYLLRFATQAVNHDLTIIQKNELRLGMAIEMTRELPDPVRQAMIGKALENFTQIDPKAFDPIWAEIEVADQYSQYKTDDPSRSEAEEFALEIRSPKVNEKNKYLPGGIDIV